MAEQPPLQQPAAAQPGAAGLTPAPVSADSDDGWKRLHPASPLLKGGIAFLAIIGILIANMRDMLIELVFDTGDGDGDFITFLLESEMLGWGLAILAALLMVGILGFYLSWRMHRYRITDESVEVRSGIIFRTHRQARLDRIQAVAVTRPFLARIFGAGKLEVAVAGQDAKVALSYLRVAELDTLRAHILRLASASRHGGRDAVAGIGQQVAPANGIAPGAPGFLPHAENAPSAIVQQRVNDFFGPELDPDLAPPESVVKISPLRIILSLLISNTTILFFLAAIAMILLAIFGEPQWLFGAIPMVIGVIGFFWSKLQKSLRFSIAGTPDGVRIGFGLLSTENDTLPAGRIHAIEVHQPLLWRPLGWWTVRINRAGYGTSADGKQPATTMLPVGTIDEVEKVLELLLPEGTGSEVNALTTQLLTKRDVPGFVATPKRAWFLHPFTWRRHGFAETNGAVLFRAGVVWRRVQIIPFARLQSIRVTQGPLARAFSVSNFSIQTILGLITPTVEAVDTATAERAFDRWSAKAIAAADDEDARAAESARSQSAGMGRADAVAAVGYGSAGSAEAAAAMLSRPMI